MEKWRDYNDEILDLGWSYQWTRQRNHIAVTAKKDEDEIIVYGRALSGALGMLIEQIKALGD